MKSVACSGEVNANRLNEPGEVPRLKLGLLDVEELSNRNGLFADLADGQREVLIGDTFKLKLAAALSSAQHWWMVALWSYRSSSNAHRLG